MTKEQQLRQEDINITNAMDREAEKRNKTENDIIDKRTKGEWESGYGHNSNAFGIYTKKMLDEYLTESPICLISPIDKMDETDKANAAFIVTACNEYEKLKKDNAILLSTMKEIAVNYPETNNSYQDTELVKYLIARAKETVYKITGSYPNI